MIVFIRRVLDITRLEPHGHRGPASEPKQTDAMIAEIRCLNRSGLARCRVRLNYAEGFSLTTDTRAAELSPRRVFM